MKLTLISVTFRGKTACRFINLPMVNGHAKCPIEILQGLAFELGARNGETYTVG